MEFNGYSRRSTDTLFGCGACMYPVYRFLVFPRWLSVNCYATHGQFKFEHSCRVRRNLFGVTPQQLHCFLSLVPRRISQALQPKQSSGSNIMTLRIGSPLSIHLGLANLAPPSA
ncbi:hypothetical protein BDBG_02078 [Blastomyces gilchristii SLH14081]|uniref:Uncharacterized protein n=2 Tax=Blastomyces TaxID=229219 RepID=A0A179UCM4_BLAGS|nr:uncharacterized protein BDBG_02078 [Blastomyces gilchristii SLH14081]EGE77469.2 hypothetical protein BDDG_00406 [Blastomyces dermatitidis ATCC 18188]OAT05736.1 hypothetical protein BDBG_02078 [Blastomyces gilchristii SLH14081]